MSYQRSNNNTHCVSNDVKHFDHNGNIIIAGNNSNIISTGKNSNVVLIVNGATGATGSTGTTGIGRVLVITLPEVTTQGFTAALTINGLPGRFNFPNPVSGLSNVLISIRNTLLGGSQSFALLGPNGEILGSVTVPSGQTGTIPASGNNEIILNPGRYALVLSNGPL